MGAQVGGCSNQVGTIESEFRVPTFEVLAGNASLEASAPARLASLSRVTWVPEG